MSSDVLNGKCPCCGVALANEPELVACFLNPDCCAACVARCMEVDHCGLIAEPEFWEQYDQYRATIGKYWVKNGRKMPFRSVQFR